MKKQCEFCNGSGQISYFKGESRFLLSEEECPECCGMGFIIPEGDEVTGRKDSTGKKPPENKEKRDNSA